MFLSGANVAALDGQDRQVRNFIIIKNGGHNLIP